MKVKWLLLLVLLMGLNDDLLDRAVTHATFLERLKTNEVRKIVGFLNVSVLPDFEAKIQSAQVRGLKSAKGLAELKRSYSALLDEGLTLAGQKTAENMTELAIAEADFERRIIQGHAPIDLQLKGPSISTLRQLVTRSPVQGRLLKDWFRGIGDFAKRETSRQLQIGLAQGETVQDLTRRVLGTSAANFQDGIPTKVRRHAEAIVRTAATDVSAKSREALFAANEDVVKGVRYVATLDDVTTQICMSLDGQIFPIEEGPRPPQHIRCRSAVSPVLKSWKELGIPAKEATPGLRASMDGQVPAALNYGQWLRGKSKDFQIEILGPGRAKIFRRDNVKFEKFIDDKQRPLTIKQLQAKEKRILRSENGVRVS